MLIFHVISMKNILLPKTFFHTNNVKYQHFLPVFVHIILFSHHFHDTHVKITFYTHKTGLES